MTPSSTTSAGQSAPKHRKARRRPAFQHHHACTRGAAPSPYRGSPAPEPRRRGIRDAARCIAPPATRATFSRAPRLLPNQRVRREKQSLRSTDDLHGRHHADSCMLHTIMLPALPLFALSGQQRVRRGRQLLPIDVVLDAEYGPCYA
jgi:hypothetical protein